MKSTIRTAVFFCVLLFVQPSFSQDFWHGIPFADSTEIYDLTINDTGELYTAVTYPGGGGILRSSDQGVTWEYILNLPAEVAFTIHADHENNLYTGGEHLYASNNNGADWQMIFSLGDNIISVYKSQFNHLFVGSWGVLYRCTIGEYEWTKVLSMDYFQLVTALVADSAGVLYMGTNFIEGSGSVYRSFDDGTTWEYIGLPWKQILTLAINASGEVFAGGVHGIYKYSGSGTAWSTVLNGPWTNSLAINKDGVIFAATANYGIYRSLDNGQSFVLINSGLSGLEPDQLAISPDGYIYATANDPPRLYKSNVTTFLHHRLSGNIHYANTYGTALSDVSIVLEQQDSVVGNSITDVNGHYSFDSLHNGIYTVIPSTSKPWGGVSALDVLLYQKQIAGIAPLSGIYLASGDVNGSGTLTAVDMLLIKKRIAGIQNSFPSGDWLFNNQPVNINDSNVIYDFNGICYGDANGSYVPPVK